MGGKFKFPWSVAEQVSKDILPRLQDGCLPERLLIAGSFRRHKKEVGDLEVLYVPKMDEKPLDMFATQKESRVSGLLESLVNQGVLQKRPNANSHFT